MTTQKTQPQSQSPNQAPDTTSIAEILLRVRIATHQVESARKQAVSVYDEDLRTLRELDASLATIRSISEPQLFEMSRVLTPEIKSLLDAPLSKYAR